MYSYNIYIFLKCIYHIFYNLIYNYLCVHILKCIIWILPINPSCPCMYSSATENKNITIHPCLFVLIDAFAFLCLFSLCVPSITASWPIDWYLILSELIIVEASCIFFLNRISNFFTIFFLDEFQTTYLTCCIAMYHFKADCPFHNLLIG